MERLQHSRMEMNESLRAELSCSYLADNYHTDHKISYEHGTNNYYRMLRWVMFQMGGNGADARLSPKLKLCTESIANYSRLTRTSK